MWRTWAAVVYFVFLLFPCLKGFHEIASGLVSIQEHIHGVPNTFQTVNDTVAGFYFLIVPLFFFFFLRSSYPNYNMAYLITSPQYMMNDYLSNNDLNPSNIQDSTAARS